MNSSPKLPVAEAIHSLKFGIQCHAVGVRANFRRSGSGALFSTVGVSLPRRSVTHYSHFATVSGMRHSCRFSGTTGVSPVAAARGSPSLCLWKHLEQLQAQLSFGARANSPVPMNYPLHTGASRAGDVARAPSPLLQGRGGHTTHAAHRLRRASRRYGNSTFILKNLCVELAGDCHTGSVRFGVCLCLFSTLVKTETEMLYY